VNACFNLRLSGGDRWRALDDAGLTQGWLAPDFDDSAWEAMSVPADWGDFDGLGWYRRGVDLPSELGGRRLYLVFDGVDDESWVWVDGELVAECHTWNRRFWADLSTLAGQSVTVAVRVNDRGLGGGIHAPVRLVLTADRTELLEGPWHRQPVLENPAWLPGSVIYEVFVRNFSESGDFEGLRARIPELKELGVDVLWLMPIHPIGEEERKGTVGSPYAIRDHMAVNPDFGTEEDLRRLVETVHEHGMRIIIDAVLNHSSPDNPLTETHRDWYELDEEGEPVADNPDWWDIVAFDWETREVWDYFSGVMLHWVREFDIDGYRCDVASLMPTEFWEELLPRLQAIKPDVLMLAESDAPDLHRASFHLTYNWTLWDMLGPVASGELPASRLADAMEQDFYTFQRGALRMPFAENHDKERAPTEYGGVRPGKAISLIALTVAPCPLLYNGQEVGYDAPRDIFETIPIDWSDPHRLRPFFRRVLEVRRGSEALRVGSFRALEVDRPDDVFAFTRRHGDSAAVVVVNVSGEGLDVGGEALAEALAGAEAGTGSLRVGIWRPASGIVSLPEYGGDVWLISPR
jgi:glycosidase